VANEDLEKALGCFRNAIRIDKRHYNAWYGLGMVYYRQEKYELAQFHFERALEINPASPALRCYVGMALHMHQRFEEALEQFDKAIQLSYRNPLLRFKRAKTLVMMERYQDALEELEKTKDLAPKEASIYRLLSEVYRNLGDKQKSLLNMTWATNLDQRAGGPGNKTLGQSDDDKIVDDELGI